MNRSAMKKKWIILISILLLVSAGIVWFNTGSETPIVVKGDLSAKDVAEIKRVVRHHIRQFIFTDFSWKSVKALPGNIKSYSHLKFTNIELSSNGLVKVSLEKLLNPKQSGNPYYQLTKGTNGWIVRGHTGFLVDN